MNSSRLVIVGILSYSGVAFGHVQVLSVKGTLVHGDVEIKSKQKIDNGGTFKTDGNSSARLIVQGAKTLIIMKPNTVIEIPEPKQKTWMFKLVQGVSRWIVKKRKVPNVSVKSAASVMGIRGTDFYASFNPMLGESEIICFKGKVNFQSTSNTSDNADIGPNQWGGIGGRFGSQIGEVLTLPPSVVSSFKSVVLNKK